MQMALTYVSADTPLAVCITTRWEAADVQTLSPLFADELFWTPCGGDASMHSHSLRAEGSLMPISVWTTDGARVATRLLRIAVPAGAQVCHADGATYLAAAAPPTTAPCLEMPPASRGVTAEEDVVVALERAMRAAQRDEGVADPSVAVTVKGDTRQLTTDLLAPRVACALALRAMGIGLAVEANDGRATLESTRAPTYMYALEVEGAATSVGMGVTLAAAATVRSAVARAC